MMHSVKLAKAKLDMTKGSDAKKAALIRHMSQAVVKENYMRLWKLGLAFAELLLGSEWLSGCRRRAASCPLPIVHARLIN